MGNCIKNNKTNYKDKLINYNIIDKKKHIVLGIYEKPINNNLKNIHNNICQGIWIDGIKNINNPNQENIHKLTFGIKILESNKVELYFENNIKLRIFKENNLLQYQLKIQNKDIITGFITNNCLKNFKKINNNSEYIDLIFDLI